ncbi:MAG: hypothetical protein LLG01_05435 [Planctomycetaceae bacterium]|nr:hypothetical protein [Planctomycetaceae bacterium]
MKSAPVNSVAAMAVLGLIVSSVFGQTAPLQDGRLLDRNIQVGSGGINAPTGGQGGVNNQLYVSGALQGYTAQIANGQLLDRNPQLGSTGYNTVSGGVGGVNRELFANRVQSGTTAFRGEVPYVALRGIQTGGAGLAGVTGVETALKSGEPYAAALSDIYSEYAGYMRPQAVSTGVPQIRSYSRAPELANLFASGASGDLAAMAQRLFGPTSAQEEASSPLGQMRLSGRVDNQIYGQINNQIDARVEGQIPGQVPAATQPAPLPGGEGNMMVDILTLLASQRQEQAAAPAQAPAAPAVTARRGKNGLVAMLNNEVIVHGLGGAGKTLFDKYMLQGQELLKQGKYYTAANAYESAAILKSSDPMPFVGWGLALLGAGEPLSAAERLKMAVATFPPLMKTRIDLPNMIDPKLLDKRLADINRRVVASQGNEAMLAFAAAFLDYNLHRDTDARYFASRLRVDAGDDPVLSGYAAFVLGEKTPATAPMPKP